MTYGRSLVFMLVLSCLTILQACGKYGPPERISGSENRLETDVDAGNLDLENGADDSP